MDITNENFLASLPEITETIKKCHFIAIDTELSGLLREKSVNRFDLPEERFARTVESSRGYFIMQFGLSCFERLDHLKYSNRTYNFYIFPQAHKLHGDIDRTFCLQAHAIQFLTEHNFDFNKLFKHGVSYLTYQEKKLLTAQLKKDMKARASITFDESGVPEFVPTSLTTYCRECIRKIKSFVAERKLAASLSGGDSSQDSNSRMSTDASGDDLDASDSKGVAETRLEFRDCSTNHRRTILKKVIECLPVAENLQVGYERGPDTEDFLYVDFMDKRSKSEVHRNSLTMAKGFLEVIELIIVNKKPLVGHNLALDLIQIINQFMEPLTDDYNAFKDTCHSLFPVIYDTKYIAHQILDPRTLTNNQSRLNDLYCLLGESSIFPKIDIIHLDEFHDERQLPHQAGYDAYMSGYCFIALCQGYLNQNQKKKSKQSKLDNQASEVSAEQQIIDEFANRIHLAYSYDFRYIYLSGEEHEPSRNHVFFVTFPDSWNLEDLFHLFHHYGGVEASKLSPTSALCALRDPRRLNDVSMMIRDSKSKIYKIYTYSEYLEHFKTTNRRSTNINRSDACDTICE